MEYFDVVIIGAGPAGISASLYTVRANLKTLVIGSSGSSLEKADKVENYYGFENPISGKELLETGIKQAKRLGVIVEKDEVTAIEFDRVFTTRTVKTEYLSKAVLIATGLPPKRPKIPGMDKFEGKGVSYCTTCDGFFFKNKKVGILGNGNYAVQEAMELLPFTKDITIFTNGKSADFSGVYAEEAERYKICIDKVIELSGGEKLEEIVLDSGSEKLDGLFVAGETASSIDFATKLGVATKGNIIITDSSKKTNIDGLFAAGDCTGGFKQISVAVGEGAIAGRSIIEYIRRNK
ncbi:MAG: FAD-dependent oxidoreductase [[Clostridium] cellulosi]